MSECEKRMAPLYTAAKVLDHAGACIRVQLHALGDFSGKKQGRLILTHEEAIELAHAIISAEFPKEERT